MGAKKGETGRKVNSMCFGGLGFYKIFPLRIQKGKIGYKANHALYFSRSICNACEVGE